MRHPARFRLPILPLWRRLILFTLAMAGAFGASAALAGPPDTVLLHARAAARGFGHAGGQAPADDATREAALKQTVDAKLGTIAASVSLLELDSVRQTSMFRSIYSGAQAPLRVPAVLAMPILPAGKAAPAVVLEPDSDGLAEAHLRYARAILEQGIGVLIVDTLGARGLLSTSSAQVDLRPEELVADAYAALRALAARADIDAARIGIVGNSKGGTSAVDTLYDYHAHHFVDDTLRFRFHVALYPACNFFPYQPHFKGGELYMILGGADTEAPTSTCLRLIRTLAEQGAPVSYDVIPGAKHGWDEEASVDDPRSENWAACVFEQQANGDWIEAGTGFKLADADLNTTLWRYLRVHAGCVRYGVEEAYDTNAAQRGLALLARYLGKWSDVAATASVAMPKSTPISAPEAPTGALASDD